MADRLSNENLSKVPTNVFHVPAYDRSKIKSSIFHIGPSKFFFAHLAVMADELLDAQHAAGKPLTYGIKAVSLRSSATRDDMIGQDFLYTVTARGPNTVEPRVIEAVTNILYAPENPGLVIAEAASPDIDMITLTVTQKGYEYEKGKKIDFNRQARNTDPMAMETDPMTAISLIAESMYERYTNGVAPAIIMPFDNFPGNGSQLRASVLDFAKDAELQAPNAEQARNWRGAREWIADTVPFISTMVDRITPTASQSHKLWIEGHGIVDHHTIETEPMPALPLAIQDPRLSDSTSKIYANYLANSNSSINIDDFKDVEAVVAPKVEDYEMLKLRTLNGSHMALGAIGYIMGHRYTHEAMQDPEISKFIDGFMAEVGQTLHPTEGFDQNEYRADLKKRLQNNSICDELTRLARNGTQDKVQPRLFAPLADCLASGGRSYGHLSFAIASWIEYMKLMDKDGCLPGTTEPNDKKAAAIGLLNIVTKDLVDPSLVFAVKDLQAYNMSQSQKAIDAVRGHLEAFRDHGFAKALANFNATRPQIPGLLHDHCNNNEVPEQPVRTGADIQGPIPQAL